MHTGQTDETTNRDFMHGQFGLAGLVSAGLLLHHQTRGALDLFAFRCGGAAVVVTAPVLADGQTM